MPKVYRLILSNEQRKELEEAVVSHAKPYVREKAAGIIKVAEGNSLRRVASHMLLRPHAPETVKKWCERYKQEGITGLYVKKGRGRKPIFSPSDSARGR